MKMSWNVKNVLYVEEQFNFKVEINFKNLLCENFS